MRRPLIAGAAVLAVLAAGGAGFAVFEHYEREGLATKSTQSCGGRDVPVPGAPTTLPLDLPLTEGETVLDVATQGRTTVAFASEPGGRDDIVAVRDKVLADLARAGYTVVGTDQEPGYEAEAELAGTHPGSLKVSPLCEGLLEVRYKIEL
jgi:hypothetical protein